ncbi:aminodeoxychorismate lyase [Rhodococcoides corynebacterioides]|uniref:Aminodeoxychorismate lyase n=1 Tax=Rhodococcoides corynebacterioides TaxID=53972 RepID=A0ABS7NYV6_9NOCA|nr:aminodeoxychorismate lyase [Rhodococcus corynebacterioides]MBY6365318.1 aminodeoxychorismate lyase [Rhodococcus corynebacterioides]MBY6408129.1 aminodeoxychorismate lyase [Rhodococcus corynebacterioides]
MTSRVVVTLAGDVLDPAVPVLHADDLGAVRGDGVFETLLVRDGTVCRLDAHLARLRRSAAAVDLGEPDLDAWTRAIGIAATAWGTAEEGAMRLYLSRGREFDDGGETAVVTVSAIPPRVASARAAGVTATTLARGYSVDVAADAPWTLLGAKTLSYAVNMAALRHAQREGFDDVIFRSAEGYVLEGPRSTVVAVTDRVVTTPPVEHGVLPGTTVDALFETASDAGFTCRRAPLRIADLVLADSVWLVSSITLAAKVTTLDSTVFGVTALDGAIREWVDTAVSR